MQRNQNQAWVAGIATAIAEDYSVSVILVRLFFIVTFFMFGAGFVLYLWIWLTYPENTSQMKLT